MKHSLLRSASTLLLCTAATSSLAIPFSSPDPRSLGMGGVGVASGTSANASFFNPALLAAAGKHDRFSLELPIVGAHLADPDNLRDAADNFDQANYIDRFDRALQQYNSALTTARTTPNATNINAFLGQASQLTAASRSLVGGLTTLSNKALQGDGGIGTIVGVPGKQLGVAVFVNAWVAGSGRAIITQSDLTTVDTIISDAEAAIAAADPSKPASVTGLTSITKTSADLTSFVEARFALLGEAGISLGHEFKIAGHPVAIGLTPKYVEVRTYDYKFKQAQLDSASIDLDTGERTSHNFNLDIGVAMDHGNGWRSGLAVKNVIAKDYQTVLDHTISIKPAARVGVAYRGSGWTVASDLDLTENDAVGFESKSQYLGLGGEIDLWRTLQLRAGLRANLSDADTNTASLGLGLSPFGVHIDLGVSAGQNEIGAALQLGFRF